MILQTKTVIISYFHQTINVAKRIHDDNIIAISIQKHSYQSNSSVTLFIVCFASFEFHPQYECRESERESVTMTLQ